MNHVQNRLSLETSPYLLQHQNNPVDWYAWGDEALQKAKAENKPILLSIGYSACHWCHVMAHESFENKQIAELMNENYVNIKVDREERPDLDQVYQAVAQIFTRGGGWPLTVFLTPDLKPFFGGTYFPPDDRYGRPGFPRLLVSFARSFQNEPEKIFENAERLTQALHEAQDVLKPDDHRPIATANTEASLVQAVEKLLRQIDWVWGGFGGAPKFPNTMALSFLWRSGVAFDLPRAREAVVLSLRKMAEGGIFDHLGGGFSRYSVDAEWSVPHFEKMLYDNALLLKLYSEVLIADIQKKATGGVLTSLDRSLFTHVVQKTVDYLLREMRSVEQAFYAAQDADSEGEEGKFFVWTRAEVEAVLGVGSISDAFCERFGVSEGGNFEEGRTVLHLKNSFAGDLLLSECEALFKVRSQRVAPGLDNKILCSWNGLAISGLTWAAQALNLLGDVERSVSAQASAEAAFQFLVQQLQNTEGRLSSTWQKGQARFNGYLDDYAFLAQAAVDLSRSAQKVQAQVYLQYAARWMTHVTTFFSSEEKGVGYYFTSSDHENLLLRPKTFYDQAIPSGVAVALNVQSVLAEIFEGEQAQHFEAEVNRHVSVLLPMALNQAFGLGELACLALQRFCGTRIVSGFILDGYWGPHIFQGLSSTSQVCYRQTCFLLSPQLDQSEVFKILGLSQNFN